MAGGVDDGSCGFVVYRFRQYSLLSISPTNLTLSLNFRHRLRRHSYIVNTSFGLSLLCLSASLCVSLSRPLAPVSANGMPNVRVRMRILVSEINRKPFT